MYRRFYFLWGLFRNRFHRLYVRNGYGCVWYLITIVAALILSVCRNFYYLETQGKLKIKAAAGGQAEAALTAEKGGTKRGRRTYHNWNVYCLLTIIYIMASMVWGTGYQIGKETIEFGCEADAGGGTGR